MDKLTRKLIIAASGVVIAVGGAWLYQRYTVHQTIEKCIAREVESSKWLPGLSTNTEKRELMRFRCGALDGFLSK